MFRHLMSKMLFCGCGLVAHQDRAQDSYEKLGASLETVNVELLKVGETCKMAIPNQAPLSEGVETRRAASRENLPKMKG